MRWFLALLLLAGAVAARADDYLHLQSHGLDRQYVLSVPAQPRSEPIPLIVVLHGGIGTGRRMQRALGFDAYVDKLGVAVAYPDAYTEPGKGKTTRWNDGRETLASTRLGVDDVAFLRDLVKDVGQRVRIDPARVFVTGPSNGGMMTYRAACEAADVFTAAAPVIGSIPLKLADRCKPSRPISLLAINGTADPYVPFAGGTVCANVSELVCERGDVIPPSKSVEFFARRDGCASEPKHETLPAAQARDPGVEKLSYDCKDARVEALWIQGGGHNWPPNSGQIGTRTGAGTRNLDATAAIVAFFLSSR